jgi:hypothetical protein
VGRGLLVFPRRERLNSHPAAFRRHCGGRALLHGRRAHGLEMGED